LKADHALAAWVQACARVMVPLEEEASADAPAEENGVELPFPLHPASWTRDEDMFLTRLFP
jgi:hypothetical protein